MKDGSYPAPSKHRWSVAVEFHDGTRIEGTSDHDVLERWRAVAVWGADRVPDPEHFRALVGFRCRVTTGVVIEPSLDGADLLDALDDAGALWVIRR